MKKDEAAKAHAREILVDALGQREDWLSVAENLAGQVADQLAHRHVEVSGLLRIIEGLGNRIGRAERRLEHYRRKEMRAHAGAIWDSIRPLGPSSLLNMAAWHRKNNDGCSAPEDPADIKRCKSLLRCAADARRRMHAQGEGVP